jgi:hypothetical protein
VITLVYGLGFGMVIVLLVVPAILAMQQDFAKQVRALRRGVPRSAAGPALPLGALAALIAALFAATLGAQIVTGRCPGRWPQSAMAALSVRRPSSSRLRRCLCRRVAR